MKKYVVDLNKDEKERLQRLTTKGKSGARKIRRARILLLLLADKLVRLEVLEEISSTRR
jgi:hypothetical protein